MTYELWFKQLEALRIADGLPPIPNTTRDREFFLSLWRKDFDNGHSPKMAWKLAKEQLANPSPIIARAARRG